MITPRRGPSGKDWITRLVTARWKRLQSRLNYRGHEMCRGVRKSYPSERGKILRYQIVLLRPETTRTGRIGARFRAIISFAVRGLLWPSLAYRERRRSERRREELVRRHKLVHGYATR